MNSSDNRGFTIIEIALVMVILGIMSSLALIKYNRTVAAGELEKAANNFYLELRSLRPTAFKYDGIVKAKFNTVAAQCTVWVDTSDDGSRKYRRLSILRLPAPIQMGTPPTTPSTWKFYPPSNTWKDSLCIAPDSRGDYEHGAIYLFSPKLDKIIYCIGITTSMQSIELHKWNGKTWTTTSL